MDVQYQYLCRILVDGSDKVNIKEEQTASKIFDINSHNFLIDLELWFEKSSENFKIFGLLHYFVFRHFPYFF